MTKFPKKIAILGVGLIGGSIALGLKKHFGRKITIFGSCKSLKRTQEAKKIGLVDEVINLRAQPQGLKLVKVNLIIIAAPIKETVNILKLLSTVRFKNCLIIDVGSTKKFVIAAANQLLKPPTSFVGTHPMAGSEMSGFENAAVNLFRNKPWIVCHDQLSTTKNQLAIIKELIDILGAKMILMDAQTHDKLSVWASHIFLVASSILVKTVGSQRKWKEIAAIASTGFRDSTRLASDNPEMKRDLVFTNKENMAHALQSFKNEIDFFLQLLDKKNEREVLQYFENTKNTRDGWIANYFS